MKQMTLTNQYVDYIPEQLSEGVLYICDHYKTAAHKCCCGCGEEVITPLSTAEWSIRKQGNMVSLHPSIGNWSFNCQSHYWICKNQVIWAKAMNQQQIKSARDGDATDKAKQIAYNNRLKEGKLIAENTALAKGHKLNFK